MRVTVLGCGSSSGVPMIGCNCAVCTSDNPKNRRTRVSIFIEINGKNLLIDTSPDLREQALKNNIKHVDAILYTHDHADHVHGLDDVRSFNYLSGNALAVYGNEESLNGIRSRFPYAFLPKPEFVWSRPCLIEHIIPKVPVYAFHAHGVAITAFEQIHGDRKTLGYRIGDFAYSTDTNDLPEDTFKALEGVGVWVVDCLRYKHSPVHATLEKALEWAGRVKPRLAVLTHMSHEMEYETLSKQLPKGVVPGYDGMKIEM